MIKKFLAFTLGEILIALTVIGVVSVLVMPQLVLGQKAAKAKAQFNTAYAMGYMLQQMIVCVFQQLIEIILQTILLEKTTIQK